METNDLDLFRYLPQTVREAKKSNFGFDNK